MAKIGIGFNDPGPFIIKKKFMKFKVINKKIVSQ